MSGTQTTIPFPVRKKFSFYNRKEEATKEDFTNATAKDTPSRYVPTVKKIVTLTSSESESDSDIENTVEGCKVTRERRTENACNTPRRRKCDDSDEKHTPSPPKQRRDKLQSSLTPSTLLNRLVLSPKKESRLVPKQLFESCLSEEECELTSKPGSNKYQNARKSLHSSVTEELSGREEELTRLQRYLLGHLDQETSGSMYISGPPGTGKTACLFKTMHQPDVRSKFKVVYINCISMKSAAAIYSKIMQELSIPGVTKSGKNSKAVIEKYLISKHKTLLLVLDEIDQLESRKQSVLYSIFEWPSIPNSKLILIGIANALDLTDRILPRLQARCELKPVLMHFAPYSKHQILDIISARLKEANATAKDTPSRYIPADKKIVTLTSSESKSDSDIENTVEGCKVTMERRTENACNTPRRRKCDDSDEEHTPSPPKQRRDKLQSSLTPSTLLNRLVLSPKKESRLVPKQLFESCLSEEECELTSKPGSNKYQNARKSLHSSVTEELPGREEELTRLQRYLLGHLDQETSGSLYISGPPGTGKTACLFKTMHQPDVRSKFKVVYINCISMKSATAIYSKIMQELSIPGVTKSGKNSEVVIEKYLISKHKTLLLVLDEIDQLESRKQSVLYSIFEWPSIPNSKLILIGIANALDLTDRILPRLQARCELKPVLMHFAPYSKQQIFDIISARLKEANATNVFTPYAIQFLAGKVAAISGDIRRALDISRRVIELAESHQVAQVLRPTNDNDTNIESLKKETETVEKPVDLKEVVTVLNGVYGGTQNLNQEQDTFPLQQKLLLCSLLLILNKGKNKDITVGKLYEVYRKVCKKRNISAVDDSDFVNMCSLVETRGILQIVGKKEVRLCKVNLQWDQEELDAALQDKQMMADIINDASCLYNN